MNNICTTEDFKLKILKRLKQLRQQHRYSRADVAAGIGYKTSKGYYDLETGKIKINLEHIVKLAAFYQVSIDFFLNPQSTETEHLGV